MARPTTKSDLIRESSNKYAQLLSLIDGLSDKERKTPFDFSNDPGKKEAHWSRDRNLRDVLIHLYEWHRLLIDWVNDNQEGKNSPFLPVPYNWKTYGQMNIAFFDRHQDTPLNKARELLSNSHQQAMTLIESLNADLLFLPKAYPWTGTSTLGSYCTSATASHYEWAIKKLKAHQKNCKNL